MQAWSLHGVGDLRLEEVPTPVPTGDEILVRVRAAGVCGSDIPRIFRLGTQVVPVVIGHEFAGDVVAVGNPADEDLVGRRAAVFPLIPCWTCPACRKGRYAQCQSNGYLGTRNNGGFAEFCLVPSRWHLLEADDSISYSSLAMVEPAAVALHALNLSSVAVADRVLVMGAGPIGLVAARLATLAGGGAVVSDVVAEKLDFARKLGIEAVQNTAEDIRATFGGELDVVIEGTGVGSALSLAMSQTRPGGRITLLGNPHANTELSRESHSQALRRELTLQGVWNSVFLGRFDSDWTRIRGLLASGALVLEDLITHRVTLDDLGRSLEAVNNRSLTTCKLMLEIP